MTSALRCAFAACAVLLLAQSALAQSSAPWPNRPIRLILPSAPGAASDVLGRTMAQRLSASLKQPVVVDNRPGAGGMLATRAVIAAPADGYTLLYGNASATVMLAALKPDVGFDVLKDLAPVALTAIGGVLLLVNPEVAAKNLTELVSLLKANPDRYTYASWGIGSNGHLTMEWLKHQTGIRAGHVPYKSIPSMLVDMTAGTVQVGWTDPVSAVPFIQSGKVRAIAVNGSVRAPKLPELPTMGEQGFPFPALGWQGIFAPVGTPPAVIARIHADINAIQASAELQALMSNMNIEPPPIWTTQQFRAMIAGDLEVWKKIVQDAKITPE